MPRPAQATALVIGALSADIERGAPPTPGGVVHHAGLALARLGMRTRVLTSLATADGAELLGPLRAEGVEVCARASALTTICENDYSGERDVHHLRAFSDPIGPDAMPAGWAEAELAHVGPLHRNDVLPETIRALRGLVGIDLQGLVREPGPEDTRLTPFDRLDEFVAGVPIVKVSEQELPFVLDGTSVEAFVRRFGVAELLVTRGPRGALVTTRDGTASVAATPAVRRHPTGAGDVFLAAYLYARVRALPPLAAARLASRVSAAKIERGEVPKGFALEGLDGGAR